MGYLLRYQSRKNKITYLAKTNTFITKCNKNVRHFQTVQDLRQYWTTMNKKTKTRLLNTHDRYSIEVINEQHRRVDYLEDLIAMTKDNPIKKEPKAESATKQKQESDLNPSAEEVLNNINSNTKISDIANKQNSKQNKSDNLDIPTLQETFDYLKENSKHCLILDLEFYLNSKQETKIKQIGGIVLGTGKQFNKFIFDSSDMGTQQQLNFLKEHNLTYTEADKLTPDLIMQEVQHFIRDNMLDTIVSWDNHLDFKTLKEEGFSKIVPSNMKTYDLERIFANTNNNNDLSLNLQNFTTILNLPHTGKWHDALDDSRAIYQLCQLYLKVLVPLNNNTKQTVPVKHF